VYQTVNVCLWQSSRSNCTERTIRIAPDCRHRQTSASFLIADRLVTRRSYRTRSDSFFGQTAAVLQDDCLFAGSIFDNICLFDRGAKAETVRESARVADIDADIANMPMGYETLVGDMGAALSGGQKQRILLARALYQRPKLLIVDEGTSHLDQDSERRVNAAVAEIGITRIIVAHRQETIDAAETVYRLHNGSLQLVRSPSDRTAR
jgi:ATP-binding cassette subfamily B protein RaxB